MVRHFTILVTALLLGMAMSAQTWVSFGKNEPAAPEVFYHNLPHHAKFSLPLPQCKTKIIKWFNKC